MSRRIPAFSVPSSIAIARPVAARPAAVAMSLEPDCPTTMSSSTPTPLQTPPTLARNHSLPLTPSTPSNSTAKLWNPARGIIFAPTPITPPTTSPRSYRTWAPRPLSSSSSSSTTTPNATSIPPDDDDSAPLISQARPNAPYFTRPTSLYRKQTDWAGILNLTPDGKEKESTPSGFNVFKEDIAKAGEAEEGGPLAETRTLFDTLEEASEDPEADELLEGEETVFLEEHDEELEDPGIERVKTPDGLEVIMWKKKPLVYTDDAEAHVPSAYQPNEALVNAAVEAKGYFSLSHYLKVEEKQDAVEGKVEVTIEGTVETTAENVAASTAQSTAQNTVESSAEVKVGGEKVDGQVEEVKGEGKTPTVVYVTNVQEMEKVSKEFENEKFIGFDMEWHWAKRLVPPRNDRDIRLGCSVIQISNDEKIVIFHLAKFPAATKTFLSPTLKKIIEDPEIIKSGVQIKNDMRRLSLLIPINPAGILDLADLHSLLFAAQRNDLKSGEKLPGSLTALCELYLKLPLFKGDVRTSDWSLAMTEQQRIYAANDVYASHRLFEVMDGIRRSLNPRPALPPLQQINHLETCELYYKRKAEAAKPKPQKPTAIRVPKDPSPELGKAYEWIKEYAKTVPGEVLTATVADLRCYALWHHQNMDVEEVAAACRDPPLGTGYVATRILEAVRQEKDLDYVPQRLLWVYQDLPEQGHRRFFKLKTDIIAAINKQKEWAASEGTPDSAEPKEQKLQSRFKPIGSTYEQTPTRVRRNSGTQSPPRTEKTASVAVKKEGSNEPLVRQLPLKLQPTKFKFVSSRVQPLNTLEPRVKPPPAPISHRIRPVIAPPRNDDDTEFAEWIKQSVASGKPDDPDRWSLIEQNLNALGPKKRRPPPTTPFRNPSLMRAMAGEGGAGPADGSESSTITLGASGELGEAIEGLDEQNYRLSEATEAGDEERALKTSNTRKVWIGVPSRRAKVQTEKS
ncbi:hypothetical protein H072_6863 [Dactylellina haptotyla CBS 200.50]|uniref:3'-5' exonuclease domain-containing protein n=1 Tax=Dactylellina haptotyla (strain CBS 200.50) TaxID=1284197 RepID=S8A949_DACHA|nr:hypothetical protein H072_6863 [Dactylellina haptotyla CBS 200.50]